MWTLPTALLQDPVIRNPILKHDTVIDYKESGIFGTPHLYLQGNFSDVLSEIGYAGHPPSWHRPQNPLVTFFICPPDGRLMPVIREEGKNNMTSLYLSFLNQTPANIIRTMNQCQILVNQSRLGCLCYCYLFQVCQNFVKWNLEFVAKTADFGNFEPEILVSLLQQNDLVIHNEMVLYR